ncbi:hypothetical protein A9995_03165 [Erythrobacter sp. QSSC1-22B]|uniref:DUF1489 family protein n=1 Tax=Erythrobacter sp. QSSC1-22B TaxID=1860125 RepID=UPI000804A278|nr:DUF1489 family protein [Erythrobacter sp. QSSC1-22B]OBX20706.1 hypothetical protein A9995_03165 [Erythrobacter sp. QSSC1-22B]
MPLHLTKIAFGAKSYAGIEGWYADRPRVSVNTRYRPTRWEECIGGSLFWIHEHNLVARSPIIGFTEQDNGRWFIDLEPRLIAVLPKPKRAHQGWRYLKGDPPRDLEEGEDIGDIMPGRLAGRLQKLGLI